MNDNRKCGQILTQTEFRQLIVSQGEDGYDLIDVRESDEYEARHLPGARHIPLGEIAARAGEIREDVFTVFYCGRGKRSALAMSMVAATKDASKFYSLDGGIEAWDGETLPGFPRMHSFDTVGSLEDILLRGMNLEKGAERLYEALVKAFQGSSVLKTLQKLYEAEEGHARMLYNMLPKDCASASRPFEELYGEMKGDLLENGESFEEAVGRIQKNTGDKKHLLLELGVDMEYQAYDLYRNLAAQNFNAEVKRALLELASQETQHFRTALNALGQAVAESRKHP